MLEKWKTTTKFENYVHNYGPWSTFVVSLMEITQLVSKVDRFAQYLTTPLVIFEIILNKIKIGALCRTFEKGAHKLYETLEGC
jgi:hypothetical protein